MSELYRITRHFLLRLRETPLLLGWLILGLLVAFFLDGWMGHVFGLINLVLIGMYALIIRWMTPEVPPAAPIKKPRLELVLALGLLGLFLVIQLLDFGIWNLQPLYGWVRGFFSLIGQWAYSSNILPDWARQDSYIAMSSTLKQLIPTLLVFGLLGYGRREMGLSHPHWKLTTILLGITLVFGLFTGIPFRAPFAQVLGLYLIRIFVNAVPEELFFRGFLLPRLERVLMNPLNALVISALLFNALHIPIEILNGTPSWKALLGMFSTAYPSGLIWGYLYQRTRSIIPGTLWHAANLNLGFFMMSM